MELHSTEFKNNGFIPARFSYNEGNVNPPLIIKDIPSGTKSLALIMDDPDAPAGTWVHWVLYNIPPVTTQINEDSSPGKAGVNDFHEKGYGGPCPPFGTHRYFFRVYALDSSLDLKEGITKKMLEEAMKSHILSQAEIVGLYRKG